MKRSTQNSIITLLEADGCAPEQVQAVKAAMGMGDPARLLTFREAADRLRVSPKTIGNWVREGRLRGAKCSVRTIRVYEQSVSALLSAQDARVGLGGGNG